MDTLIPAFLRRQRNQRRLTLEMLSAKVGMSPQHLSEIESGKRDPRLSSIERMAEAMGMTVLIVPDGQGDVFLAGFGVDEVPRKRAEC